jgi:arylsulfatase
LRFIRAQYRRAAKIGSDLTIKGYLMYGAQAIAAAFVDSLKDYPPRQKPQSFNLDQILERLQRPAESD